VAAALAFGRGQGLEISVRGGGHNFSGVAVVEAGLMIDLSPMRAVTVDPAQRRARCGGGTTWAELDAATQVYGLAVTGGYVSHTGVGGLTLGGGIGWLIRKTGLTCDNLVSAEVVTADGDVLKASTQENADLFWALRGGGGNFGVVTSFEFALHDVGPLAHLGMFFWSLADSGQALKSVRELLPTLPDDMGVMVGGMSAPAEPFVPEQHHLAPGFALWLASFTSTEQLDSMAEQVRCTLPPLFELLTPIPYTELQKLVDASQPWGSFAYEKGLYLDDLSDDAIAVMVEHLPQKASPTSSIAMFPLAGAYRRVRDEDTAFGGRRSARFMVTIGAPCPTAELLGADRPWVRAFWEALLPHAPGVASYVNFMAEYEDDRVRAAYGAEKYDRLAHIKTRYDPNNVFHLNANIKPALIAT
jgi:FAD/FMN-containing dehydrogenase